MGNALVVAVIEKIGIALKNKINQQKKVWQDSYSV